MFETKKKTCIIGINGVDNDERCVTEKEVKTILFTTPSHFSFEEALVHAASFSRLSEYE